MTQPIRVFIIDDSAVVRMTLTKLLEEALGIKVIGSANDPIFAQSKMMKEWPDVIILDVEMPRMDGITYLQKIMEEHPTPVIMCSKLTAAGSKTSVKAMALGAIDVIAKPKTNLKTSLQESARTLIAAVRTAAGANIMAALTQPINPVETRPAPVTVGVTLGNSPKSRVSSTETVIAIGASTGGTQALESILKALPTDTPPILIVQHMMKNFTLAFAQRLNQICQVEVKEAADNDRLMRGRVLIAPGGRHMMLRASSSQGATVSVRDGPQVSLHKPSVNVLFQSVSKYAGGKTLGIIMTGMGKDGASGIKEMHDANATTIAQNKESCVVYGMPKEAVKLGAIDHVVPLSEIPKIIVSFR